MRKTLWNLVRAVILLAAVVFALTRSDIPVVKAAGCPPAESVGQNCTFQDGVCVEYDGHTDCTCYYSCFGGYGGGGDPMYIEQVVYTHD